MKITFPTKGYGRIYCHKEDENRIKEIIKEMDSFEYNYLPSELICSEKPIIQHDDLEKRYIDIDVKYTHKFDEIDINELQMRCFMEDIPIVCFIGSSSYCDIEEGPLKKRIYLE